MTKPQVARLKRMLEAFGSAPFLALSLVPEGVELLLVLLGETRLELLELPVGLVLAGGAREKKN